MCHDHRITWGIDCGGAARRHAWNTEFQWTRSDTTPRRLDERQLAQFHESGWIVVDDLIDADALAELIDELDTIDQEVEALLRTQPDERLFIAEAGAITFAPHLVTRSPAAQRVSRAPAVVDLCHDLLGADVRLYWDQMVYKKPAKPRAFPWHQDNGYTYLEPQQYLTIWLALTDATLDNGCPWVAPGLHRHGTLAHTFVEPLGLTCFDAHDAFISGAAPATVAAGGAVVFSSLTPHLTGPNTSPDVRKAYILQYAPDGAEVLEGDPAAGPPTGRRRQDDRRRQYPVLAGGGPVS